MIIVGGATGEDTQVKGTALTQSRLTFPNLSLLIVYCRFEENHLHQICRGVTLLGKSTSELSQSPRPSNRYACKLNTVTSSQGMATI